MKKLSGRVRRFDAGSVTATLILLLIGCLGPVYFGSVLPRERAALQIGAFMALAAVIASRKGPRQAESQRPDPRWLLPRWECLEFSNRYLGRAA